jgi:6-phosphogluconate dehydrogenase
MSIAQSRARLTLAKASRKPSPCSSTSDETRRLLRFKDRLSDSGEGRWSVQAPTEEGVLKPVLNAALTQRFASRGAEDVAEKVLSTLRYQFGGHEEKRS